MSRRFYPLLGGGACALMLAITAAPALARTDATCSVKSGIDFSPGLSATDESGSLSSREQRGLTCAGNAASAFVAGTGSFVMRGTYATTPGADRCVAGTGEARLSGDVPAVLGHSLLSGVLQFDRRGTVMFVTGRGFVASERFFGVSTSEPVTYSGVFTIVPRGAGTCAANPLNTADLVGVLQVVERQPDMRTPESTTLESAACAAEIVGTRGPDSLTGDDRGELIRGLGGNDRITAAGGDDCLYGNAGADRLVGDSGNDILLGGPGADRIVGGAGDDGIVGGSALDKIDAGAGNDTIDGADGKAERIRCGSGTDSARVDKTDRLSGCERVRRR